MPFKSTLAAIAVAAFLGFGSGSAVQTAEAGTMVVSGGYYQTNSVYVPGQWYATTSYQYRPGYYQNVTTYVPTSYVVHTPTVVYVPAVSYYTYSPVITTNPSSFIITQW